MKRDCITVIFALTMVMACLSKQTARAQAAQGSEQRISRQLLDACDHGDASAAIQLLNEGANANTHMGRKTAVVPNGGTSHANWRPQPWNHFFTYGDTPLLLAVNQRPPELLRILFLPSQIPDLLKTSEQRLRLVEALLSKGAQVNIRNSQGMTPLMIAACNCDTEMLEILLRHGARINDRDIDGSTGLIWAVTRRFPNELTAKTVSLLIKHRANVNIRSDFFGTALSAAQNAFHDSSVIDLLQNAGATE